MIRILPLVSLLSLQPLLGYAAVPAAPPAAPSPSLLRASDDFSRVAETVNPSVVNIASTQTVRERISQFPFDLYDDPFGGQGREVRRQSLGSGVILDAAGQILTNWHVVNGADEISVRLDNGEVYPAKVLGGDEGVDLAVLKINPKQPLRPARLGDSDKVKVGDWAIAIGNPFGFDHSLTVGVISAKERGNVLGASDKVHYQNFLQTDASINQGNSGGPLCNIRGEIIGINTAISTPNQGSIGIGFAIPINMVKRSIPDLVHAGRVVPPHLGFYTQDIDARLAAALKLSSMQGVLITDVAAGAGADKAGLKRGDIVTGINGKNTDNSAELKTRLYEARPGEPLLLSVLRNNASLTLRIEPSQLQAVPENVWHGIEVEENGEEKARAMGLATAQGLVVKKVAKNSSAGQIGIAPGDLLMVINKQRLNSMADWKKLSRQVDESEEAAVLIVRGRASAFIVLPGEK
ncbi:MAG: trypsin-like peptidase domain-containing protein [candidate division FCPU426 bacterium]